MIVPVRDECLIYWTTKFYGIIGGGGGGGDDDDPSHGQLHVESILVDHLLGRMDTIVLCIVPALVVHVYFPNELIVQ